MRTIKSRKGDINMGLMAFLNIAMFFIIMGTAVFLFIGADFPGIIVESKTRTFGATIDAVMLTPGDAVIVNACPPKYIFTFHGKTIHAVGKTTFGTGTADYSFMAPSQTKVSGEIDCKDVRFIRIEKTVNKVTGQTGLTVEGFNEE